MPFRITQVDAFTNRPFTGNPAGVCILAEPEPDWWMQDVAREMNLSETAFLIPHEEGYDLRWFTPIAEVDLCGHATLASAHVLWEDGHLPPQETARFHTRSGVLLASRRDDWIELDFPAKTATEAPVPEHLTEALGIEPIWIGRSDFDYLVQVDDEKQVRTLSPDFGLLKRIDVRGVIVTAVATGSTYDYVSRFFAPRVGIDEDPVTGSAHCALGPFWSARLGRDDLVGYQVSPRGGRVRTRAAGDRVILGGQAVTVMRADLL
jgi:PhzF family phenazine biosynthesis protein